MLAGLLAIPYSRFLSQRIFFFSCVWVYIKDCVFEMSQEPGRVEVIHLHEIATNTADRVWQHGKMRDKIFRDDYWAENYLFKSSCSTILIIPRSTIYFFLLSFFFFLDWWKYTLLVWLLYFYVRTILKRTDLLLNKIRVH